MPKSTVKKGILQKKSRKTVSKSWKQWRSAWPLLVVVSVFAVVGLVLLFKTMAATPYLSREPETGTRSPGAVVVDDTTASGDKSVRFSTLFSAPNPYACAQPYPILRFGAEGTCVQRLQYDLNKAFNDVYFNMTGEFGASTEDKVREYQALKNLTVDGVVGKATWQSLEPGVTVQDPTTTPPPPIGTVGGAPGYAFPVEPQRKSQNAGVAALSPLPCNNWEWCHRGTAAFDIGRQPGGDSSVGANIYAISNGTVTSVKIYNGISGCYAMHLRSSTDGFDYWYGHTGIANVSAGQIVKVGQKINDIGRRACTGNGSSPHLHIDRGCIIGGVKQPGGTTNCRDWDFVPLMNKIFNGLPS